LLQKSNIKDVCALLDMKSSKNKLLFYMCLRYRRCKQGSRWSKWRAL